MRTTNGTILIGVLLTMATTPAAAAGLAVSGLEWAGQQNPLGLVEFEPRLSWVVSGSQRLQRQSAYQVLVASRPALLKVGKADLWDSGKVSGGQSLDVRYGGTTPQARQRGYYTVRVWDDHDRPSPFATPAWWEMGLPDEEWEGQWVGRPHAPGDRGPDHSVTLLRKSFSVPGAVRRARLYVSAFGVYEARINGRASSGRVLAPGFTDYEKRVPFQTDDVTGLLRKGDNVIATVIAGGWCTAGLAGARGACGEEPPRVMVQLEIETNAGERLVIVSDESWRSHPAPSTFAHLHEGEHHDARRALPGWDAPAFDDGAWAPAQQYDKKIERDLVPDPGPPIEISEDRKPVKVTTLGPGVSLFDFGRPLVGWARLAVKAQPGAPITLRYGVRLDEAGRPTGDALAVDRYTARGTGGVETWEPRFTLHAFRFVEVAGLPQASPKDAITGRVVHSRMRKTGSLETSDPRLDRLLARIDDAHRAAFVSVPLRGMASSDRQPALFDAGVFAQAACLNRDVHGFHRKWINDIRDAQLPNAAYAALAPRLASGEAGLAGTAGIMVPFALLTCYGDRAPIDAHHASMGRWLAYVREQNPQLVWERARGAEPADPGERGGTTDPTLIATAELHAATRAFIAMARQGGLSGEASQFEGLAAGTRAAFARAFVKPDGKLVADTQTAYAVAITSGVLDETARARVAPHLVAAIERQGGRFTTGVRGTAALLPALATIGRDDLAYRMLFALAEGDAQDYAMGAIATWMFDAVGGIALDAAAPGGAHVFIRPRPGGDLTFARGSFESAHGPIRTDWRVQDRVFRLRVTIPANGSATVVMPWSGEVFEGGRPAPSAVGVKALPPTPGTGPAFAVGAGVYDFVVNPR